MLDELQKWVRGTVGPTLETFLEPLAQCRNVATLIVFCMYYFGRYPSELADTHFLIAMGGQIVILLGCMIFISLFLYVLRIFLSTDSFFAQLGCGTFCLENAFY